MAVGFSGSNGGISEREEKDENIGISLTCRVLAKTDIEAGLNKYLAIIEKGAPESTLPMYRTIVNSLSRLHERLKKREYDSEESNR